MRKKVSSHLIGLWRTWRYLWGPHESLIIMTDSKSVTRCFQKKELDDSSTVMECSDFVLQFIFSISQIPWKRTTLQIFISIKTQPYWRQGILKIERSSNKTDWNKSWVRRHRENHMTLLKKTQEAWRRNTPQYTNWATRHHSVVILGQGPAKRYDNFSQSALNKIITSTDLTKSRSQTTQL